MYKKLKIILLFISATIILVSCRSESAELIIINKSNENISTIYIELHKSKKQVKNLNIGDFTVVRFNSFTDSHYKVIGKYSSGKEFETEFGYVTNGINLIDTLIIYDDSQFYYSSNIK